MKYMVITDTKMMSNVQQVCERYTHILQPSVGNGIGFIYDYRQTPEKKEGSDILFKCMFLLVVLINLKNF